MSDGAVQVVVGERACAGCSYNLEGLREDGVCPECGESAARSLREWTVARAPVRFREGLSRALFAACVGIGLQVSGAAAWGVALLTGDEPLIVVAVPVVLLGVIISWVGHLFAAEDAAVSARQDRKGTVRWARAAVRNGVAWQMATALAGVAAFFCAGAGAICAIAFGIAWWMRADQMLAYTAWLAGRGDAPGLASMARWSRWVLPVVAFGVTPFLPWLGLPVAAAVYLGVLWRLRGVLRRAGRH